MNIDWGNIDNDISVSDLEYLLGPHALSQISTWLKVTVHDQGRNIHYIFRRHHRTPCDDGGMVAKGNQAESHMVSDTQLI